MRKLERAIQISKDCEGGDTWGTRRRGAMGVGMEDGRSSRGGEEGRYTDHTDFLATGRNKDRVEVQ